MNEKSSFQSQNEESNYETSVNNRVFTCSICSLKFSNKYSADEHKKAHLSGGLLCPVCQTCFARMNRLQQHISKEHPNFKDFICQFCNTSMPTLNSFNSHIKINHGDKLGIPARFLCKICSQSFYTGKALAIHRISKHPKNITCKICNVELKQSYLKIHMNAVHSKKKEHICETCGKKFYARTGLVGHIKRHHLSRDHLCHLCGKGYVNNIEFQRHLKAHSNQRDFKCDICGFAFLKQGDLTYHRRGHTGERPYKCSLCLDAFTRPSALKNHILNHSTIKKAHKKLKHSKYELSTQDIEAQPEVDKISNTAVEKVDSDTKANDLRLLHSGQKAKVNKNNLSENVPGTSVQNIGISEIDGQLEFLQMVRELERDSMHNIEKPLHINERPIQNVETSEKPLLIDVNSKSTSDDLCVVHTDTENEKTGEAPVQVIIVQLVEDGTNWQ